METMAKKFYYIHSCDMDANVYIKIGSLEGMPTKLSYEDVLKDPSLKFSGRYFSDCSDFYVECSVYSDGRMLGFPIHTSYKPFTTRWSWNEWVALPLKFCDLPRNALLCLTIWDCHGPGKRSAVGGTTVSFFGRHGQLREGIHDLKVWQDVEADGSENSATFGKLFKGGHQEMRRLSKLVKKHHSGLMQRVDWLDRMTFREIELINEKEKRATNQMYLMVEFPRFEHQGIQYTVVYFEPDGEEAFQVRTQTVLSVIPDPELFQENLAEAKHQKLARSLRSGLCDKDLKPNSFIRDTLQRITQSPPTQTLTSEEQDLVWRYRFYLTANRKALSKFLQCVPWNMKDACKQASELLAQWSPPDPEDALELLGPKYDAYSAQNMVRKYAVSRLKQAPDDDLLLYLLQLVQALKYENLGAIIAEVDSLSSARGSLSVSGLSISPASSQIASEDSITSSTSEHTPAGLEVDLDTADARFSSVVNHQASPGPGSYYRSPDRNDDAMSKPVFGAGGGDVMDEYSLERDLDLTSFLIHRACHNTVLASYFHWYLLIECEDPPDHAHNNSSTAGNATEGKSKIDAASTREMYLAVMKRFRHALVKGGKECRLRRSLLSKQQLFVDKLVNLMKTIARESGNRRKKIERLRSLLSDPQSHKLNLSSFDPLPFPLDPEIKIIGVLPEKSTLFKSSLMPAKLTFRTSDQTDIIAIFKHGDDLRQDQLILQMIILMDKLMRRDHLDLKLTPYRVLATSTKHGFVQYVESMAIAEILTQEGSIQNYLRKTNPSETAPYGIAADVMDNYVCSCAGYCIITYLLGVGDRHLDNLLLTNSGRLFHIDFGYILGRDPKPMPPPMKLSREMVEAMGGPLSDHYQEFKRKCFLSFLYLRRHANLIINLFTLMIDANVPDIALEPDKTVRKVQDKFCLHMTDEEAVQYIKGIIDESVSAVMPVLVEQIHKFAQYWRK